MQGAGKQGATPLVTRAALGLLRVAQRLLPYKEGTGDALLKSLQLLLRLGPGTAWDLAQPIASEVGALLWLCVDVPLHWPAAVLSQ